MQDDDNPQGEAKTLRGAWFEGWRAAKIHTEESMAGFSAARLQGDTLVWSQPKPPANPYPDDDPIDWDDDSQEDDFDPYEDG